MVMGAKERQDVEMAAQQETLEEQRSHIQILDSALSQAQAQVLRLEEESREASLNDLLNLSLLVWELLLVAVYYYYL